MGLERSLAEMTRDNVGWVAIGQVTAVESHASWGWLCTISLRPSGREVQARIANLGAGAGAGIFWPIAVDDEVEVFFPDGDPNRAVCRPGLPNAEALPPAGWDNTKILVEGVDRDVEIATGQGGTRAYFHIDATTGTITADGPAIKLGAGAVEQLIKGNTFQTLFNAHAHSTPVGPSGTPLVPLTGSELSTVSTTE